MIRWVDKGAHVLVAIFAKEELSASGILNSADVLHTRCLINCEDGISKPTGTVELDLNEPSEFISNKRLT